MMIVKILIILILLFSLSFHVLAAFTFWGAKKDKRKHKVAIKYLRNVDIGYGLVFLVLLGLYVFSLLHK